MDGLKGSHPHCASGVFLVLLYRGLFGHGLLVGSITQLNLQCVSPDRFQIHPAGKEWQYRQGSTHIVPTAPPALSSRGHTLFERTAGRVCGQVIRQVVYRGQEPVNECRIQTAGLITRNLRLFTHLAANSWRKNHHAIKDHRDQPILLCCR